MICETLHTISIANLKSGEVITHRLIVIRGNINNSCDFSRGDIEDLTTGQRECFDLVKGNRFKVLWCLRDGLNRIRVNYCNAENSLNLNYSEAETKHRIQPLYIVCEGHDGHFNAADGQTSHPKEACRKITLGLQLVQCLYAEKLLEHGFPQRMTFTLNSDCRIFRSHLSAERAKLLSETELWNEFGREILNSDYGSNDNLKFVAFIACTKYEQIENGDYSYENIKRHTKAQANLGGGGLALFGSGYLYCWPSRFDDILACFEDSRRIDLEHFLDDSNYRRTYGGCYATTIGAVCHELGHIFDLGHTSDGIMGNGFDYVNLVFTNKQLTENLPNRIIETAATPYNNPKDHRLTAIKRPGQFLQKYHEQKAGDSTFFTRNCAVILSLHRWINPENSQCLTSDEISLQSEPTPVVSCNSSFLRLIEIREKQSNLVTDYLDLLLSSKSDLRSVNLVGKLDLRKHSLFVITSNGSTKYFA